MKKENRHISTEMKRIIRIAIAILVFVVSRYIFKNYFVGRSFKDNIPLFIVGILVVIIAISSYGTAFSLICMPILTKWDNYTSKKSYLKSKEQIKALPNTFVNVHFKDFDSFRLASFVDSEDITCFAKLDENGKVVYAIQLNVEYETDDYEIFLRHFDI